MPITGRDPYFVDSNHTMTLYDQQQPMMSRKGGDFLNPVEQFRIRNDIFPTACGRLGNGNINGSQSPPTNSSSNSDSFDNGSEENNFTSLKELSKHLPKGPAEVPSMKSAFHNEYKLNELMKQTGYNVTQRNGQRIYGGPPPNWKGPAPDKGSEVFVGKVPRDMYEWELVPLFETCGRIYELRLMMDFSGSNRGYMFVRFFTRDEAKRAHKELNDYEVRPGKIIGVLPSVDNRKLWISGIPKNRTAEEIKGEMSKITEGVTDVYIYSHPVDKTKTRGYAFIEYQSHRAAALARRKLVPGRNYIFEHEIEKVDWAEPENEVDEETMSKVKILFLRNLTPNVSETELEAIFENASNGPVERVKKAKDFAFIHFTTRSQAESAFVNIKNSGLYLDGHEVEVQWSKPIDRQNHHQRKQLTKVLSTGNVVEPVRPIPLIPIANNPYGLPAFGQFPSVNPVMVPPRPRGAAGIRGLGAPGTAPPRSLVRQLNQFDRMSLQENGRNFALKLRFDTGFDNGPSQAWIPQVPTSPPPVNGNGYGHPNARMMAPPPNGGMGIHFPFYYPAQTFN